MLILLYLAVAAVVFLPGLFVPADWTGTEARRVQIALEMLAGGNWLVPTHGFEPTLAKPPLHYWVLCGLLGAGGQEIWLLRLPAALAFAGVAWLAHRLVERSHGRAAAFFAGLGLLTAPLVAVLVPRAEIDPLFAALTAASILLLAHGAAFGRRTPLLLGGVAGGLALLAKGPAYFLFLAGTAAVWLRRRRGSGLLTALAAMAVLPAAWLWAVASGAGTTDELLDGALVETVGRASTFAWQDLLEVPKHLLRAVLASLPFGFFLFHEYRGERAATPDAPETFVRLTAAAAFGAVLLLVALPERPARYLLPAVPLFVVAVSPSVAAFATQPMLAPAVQRWLAWLAVPLALGGAIVPWLPAPYGPAVSLAAFAAAFALPRLRSGRAVAVAILAAAPLAVWLVVPAAAEFRALTRDSFAHPARVLARAVAARDAGELATLLHVPSQVLLNAGLLPRGDELARRVPRSRWLLMEEGARPQDVWRHVALAEVPPPGYVPRARVQLARRDLVLLERE